MVAHASDYGTRAAWRRAAGEVLSRRSVSALTKSIPAAADRRDALFGRAVADVLRLGSGPSAIPCHGRETPPRSGTADPSVAPRSLRQRLAEQGVTVLGLILQPTLIYTDAYSPALLTEPDLPTDGGSTLVDQAERSAVHLLFGAKIAAARICPSKGMLAAELRSLHRERRACLRALHDTTAARRAVQARERLARAFRRSAALTAPGVPPRPVLETPEDMQARVKAAILSKLGG